MLCSWFADRRQGTRCVTNQPSVRQISCSYHMAGPEQSIAAVFFFHGVATAEDRRCDSEPWSLKASEAGCRELSTLPRGVWLTVRCAYNLHHEDHSIARSEFE